jgi:hypothetical protein
LGETLDLGLLDQKMVMLGATISPKGIVLEHVLDGRDPMGSDLFSSMLKMSILDSVV